jgi:uncharacterized protein (DUF4415 family)
MLIDFDPVKNQLNLAKHGISLLKATELDWARGWLQPDGVPTAGNVNVMTNMKKRIRIRMPTEEEDREITAAALADPDAQPMTDEELDSLVPYKVYLRGRPKLANKKQLVSVRYSPEVLQWFRATGPGWQARMDEALKAHIARKPKLD